MNKNEIVRINDETPAYSSMVVASREDMKLFFNAVENPTSKISDYINQKIAFINVYMEQVELTDEETGETRKSVKTVLIQPNGEGIISPTSMGIARSLYAMFQIFGTPDTWNGEIMEAIVRQVDTKNGRTFKLEVV